MKVDSNYQEHVAIMKELQMGDGFYEVREPFKESFEKIYEEAKEQGVTVSNAKEFLNSLSKEELSTLQNYTRLVNEIDVDSLSDEGAFPPNIKIENGQIVHGGYKEYSYDDIINNITNFLDPKSQNESSEALKNTMRNFLALFKENYKKAKEEETILESYTKNNKQNPLENQAIEQTSQTDNKYDTMFQKIIEDGKVTYDEVQYFTYEQAKAFPEYLMQKDENGEFIPSTLIDVERKTGMLLSAATIDKAVFHSVRKIEDEEILETFMYDITGTKLSDKIFAYPELQSVDFSEYGGFSQFVTKKVASYQVKLDNATTEEEKETYQALVGAFTRLDHMNKSFNNQSIHDNSDPLEKMRALVEDLISIIKTGFTVEELEHIEELLKKIREKIKEYKENGTGSLEDINDMIKEIERAIVELQKRITGVAILEVDDSTYKSTGDFSFATLDDLNIEGRLDAVQDSINKMRSGGLLDEKLSNDEEEQEDKKEE